MKKYIIALAAILGLASCAKEGEIITTEGAKAVELSGSGDVVLTKDNAQALALTLNWTDNSALSTSDERVQTPLATVVNTLEFASAESFEDFVEVATDAGTTSMQFTVEQLNSVAGRAGLPAEVKSPLHIRVRSVLSNNTEALYSNVYSIFVTTYGIEMTFANILDSGKNETGAQLYSKDSDGIYSGFVGAGSWQNWWLQEANGVIWGNLGVDGKAFFISTAADSWNMWYPGVAGCYYTVVDTKEQKWSALTIPALNVTGDISGAMVYDRASNRWALPCTVSSSTLTVQISGTGKQYNTTTGTDDAAAVSTPVAFGMENGAIVFGSTASDITLSTTVTGTATLILDLSDPSRVKYEFSTEEVVPQQTPKQLYILGNDDKWDYTQYLTLYDETNVCYAALVNFDCSYGYYFSKEKEDWIKINQDPSTDEKKLIVGGNDIAAPGKGLYVTVASMGWMSYWYELSGAAVTTVQIAGLNDKWDLVDMTQDSTNPCVFTVDVEAAAANPWGVKIILNADWDSFFGTRLDGTLCWKDVDNGSPAWETGKSYRVTVDLGHCTYTLNELK